jgi:hypothetical protein
MDWDLFDEEVKADQYSLERCSQEQANLRVKYLSKYPDLVQSREIIKKEIQQKEKELKALEGNISLNVRENPSTFGISKVTEATVDAIIMTHPERKVVLSDIHDMHLSVIQFQKQIDELEVIKACLDDRKDSISILSKLYINAYYADNPLDQLNEKCERMKKGN